MKFETTAQIPLETLAKSLSTYSWKDIYKLVIEIDNNVSDWEFSFGLARAVLRNKDSKQFIAFIDNEVNSHRINNIINTNH